MPNWCINKITIKAEKEKLNKLEQAFKEGKFCSAVLPEPDYTKTPVPLAFPEIMALFAKTQAEKEKILENKPSIREDACLHWRVDNWGTKWDILSHDLTRTDEELTAVFDSAWSPPIGVYEKLVKDGYNVKAWFIEPGVGFGGIYTNGDVSMVTDLSSRNKVVDELNVIFKDHL